MARIVATFAGNNGIGAISVTEAELGDQIIATMFVSGAGAPGLSPQIFAPFVIVDGEVLQTSATDYSGSTFAILLDRQVLC